MDISAENIRLIFGLKLKELRDEKGFSLSELSRKTGISKSYLNEIEKGKKYPKTEKITRLADVFEVSYESLVSLNLNKRLSPISDLIKSNLLSELPLEFFGLDSNDLLTLLSTAPTKFSAFVDAIIQIGREHNIQVESLYFSVLRSYQEMYDNYFPEIETVAKQLRKDHQIDGFNNSLKESVENILTREYKYVISYDGLCDVEALTPVRYLFIQGKKPQLLLNTNLDEHQKLFILARELGICALGLTPRNNTSSWIDAQSFGHVLNNFKAYYFASALILDERIFTKGLVDFTKRSHFNTDEVLEFINKSQIQAEPFLLRINTLVPRYFRFSQMFFLRYNQYVDEDVFKMTKILHSSGLPRSSKVSIAIKACQRWAALTTLKKLSELESTKPICTVYKVQYHDDKNKYLIISVAQKVPATHINSCISVGFLINKRFSEKTNFVKDTSIHEHIVEYDWLVNSEDNIEDGLNKSVLKANNNSIENINNEINLLTSQYQKKK